MRELALLPEVDAFCRDLGINEKHIKILLYDSRNIQTGQALVAEIPSSPKRADPVKHASCNRLGRAGKRAEPSPIIIA